MRKEMVERKGKKERKRAGGKEQKRAKVSFVNEHLLLKRSFEGWKGRGKRRGKD